MLANNNEKQIMLTSLLAIDDTLSMAGKIRTKEKCPKCQGKFQGESLECPTCLTTPKRYFIDLYEKGYGRLKVYSDKQGYPLASHMKAARVLEAIRYELDQHIFDPTKYSRTDLRNFFFETRVEAWYEDKKAEVEKGNISEGHLKNIRCSIDKRCLPFFKCKDVREIRSFHIQEFYKSLPSDLSLGHIKNIMAILDNFFHSLYRFEFIDRKPTFPVIMPHQKAPKWIDADTQMEILNRIPERDRPIFTFLAFQGVRPGEVVALKVKDIDFKMGYLTIARTFSSGKVRERVKSKIQKPRLINPALVDLLSDHCKDKHPEAFVFINRWGRAYSKNYMFQIWDAARGDLDITLYQATRHSVASIAACHGAPLTAIKDVLGHTDIRTTMVYAHTNLESQKVVFMPPTAEKIIKFVSPDCPQTSDANKGTGEKANKIK